MHLLKKIISIIATVSIMCTAVVTTSISVGASGSGAGLAEWALNAYYSNWKYVYGGASAGAVDCSGLIYSYAGGYRTGLINYASYSGSVSSGIPNIHGLGLFQPGHYGVYVGNGMAVDARDSASDMKYQSTATKAWTKYFKVPGVSYPTTGWEKFSGDYYYYENGQYITSTTRTIGGTTFTFSSDGSSDKTPSGEALTSTSSSTSKSNASSSSKNSSSSSSSKNSSSSSSATSSSSSADDVYKLGSSGKAVTKIQNRLTELGFYDGDISGYFGDVTEEAYKAFQTAAGVTVDGICGKSDRVILYSDNAPIAKVEKEEKKAEEEEITATEELSETNDQEKYEISDTVASYITGEYDSGMQSVQERLVELKYIDMTPSGIFDENTSEALVNFQNANSIMDTGYADSFTQEVLFSAGAVENPNPDSIIKVEATEPVTTEPTTVSPTTVSASAADMKTNDLSEKALANVANDGSIESVASTEENPLGFLKWLVIVLAVMSVAFVVVFIGENRKRSFRNARHVDKMRKYW